MVDICLRDVLVGISASVNFIQLKRRFSSVVSVYRLSVFSSCDAKLFLGWSCPGCCNTYVRQTLWLLLLVFILSFSYTEVAEGQTECPFLVFVNGSDNRDLLIHVRSGHRIFLANNNFCCYKSLLRSNSYLLASNLW